MLLVDDHPILCAGITRYLEGEFDALRVCGEVREAKQALAAIRKLRPDLVLLDIEFKDGNGLNELCSIRAEYPDLPIIVLSCHESRHFVELSRELGASGYCSKGDDAGKLVHTIVSVLDGSECFPGIGGARGSSNHAGPSPGLSARENEVLSLLGSGNDSREVAGALGLSVKTVETYVRRLMEKLGVSSLRELTRYAVLRHGRSDRR